MTLCPDAKTYKSRLYHIYNDPEVKDDLNRKAEEHEPLPDLVINGYYLLGYDWRETAKDWAKAGFTTPPVMITVANRTETAARIKYAFDHKKVRIDELADPERTLHIDSKVLDEAEAAEEPIAEFESALPTRMTRTESTTTTMETASRSASSRRSSRRNCLRRQVDTVGQVGQARRTDSECRFRSACFRKAGTPRPSRTSWVCARSPASFSASRSWAADFAAQPTNSIPRRVSSSRNT